MDKRIDLLNAGDKGLYLESGYTQLYLVSYEKEPGYVMPEEQIHTVYLEDIKEIHKKLGEFIKLVEDEHSV